MSLKFYIGRSGSGKSSCLQEDIIAKALENPNLRFFILVPDQFTMQTQKEMIERHPKHGFMNIEIFSFGRLAHYIFEEAGCPERITLDDTGKNLILRKIASKLEEELPCIGRQLDKTGYIHEVKSVISEFMQYGLNVADVDKICAASSKKPVLQAKLKDINFLYQKFLEYLGEKYITTEETMDLLAEALDRSELIKDSVVVLDGFTGFTPVQDKVIAKLLVRCREVIMSVTCPVDVFQTRQNQSDDFDLFHLSLKSIRKMEALAKEVNVPRGEDRLLRREPVFRYISQPVLAHLEANIFRKNFVPYPEKAEGLCMFSALSPREELREICIRIQRLIREEKYAYRDFAVITGDLNRYAPFVTELFAQYDIPVFLDNNRKLTLNPFTEYLKSGLHVIRKNFSYESVIHFLRSGLTGIGDEEIDRLENYMLAVGIHGERGWNRMFVRYADYMQGDESALRALNQTREKVMELLSPLLVLKKGGKAEEMVRVLYHYVADYGIYEKLQAYCNMFHEQGDFVREKEYDQIYTYLMQLLEQMASLLEGEELTLTEFIQIMEAGISEIQVGILPQDNDRVVVGDVERTRLKQIKVLFFAGVNEGIIPKQSGGGGMISDLDREYIRDAGFELSPTPREKMQTQRLYLYMNMTKPAERLIISYAHTDSEGQSLRPSYLIETIKKMFPILKDFYIGQSETVDSMVSWKDGRGLLAKLLQQYAAGILSEEQSALLGTLYEEYGKYHPEQLVALREAAFYQYHSEKLNATVTKALYGRVLENSISRMERFVTCAYAHFLQYGMRLNEREEYRFENVDMGNFFHEVLCRFGNTLVERGLTWTQFTKQQAEEILDKILISVAAEYGESVIYKDSRTAYQLKRIRRIMLRTVESLKYQLSKGRFLPREMEYAFRKEVELKGGEQGLTEDEKIMLRGKIDRYDTYETEDAIYVKVIDYKSSEKKLDLTKLYYGAQLQLAVYLDQALERVKKQNAGKEVLPAAMFYYPMIDPVMEQENHHVSEATKEKMVRDKLRVSGLMVEDKTVVEGLDGEFIEHSDVVNLERKKDGGFKANSEIISSENLMTLTSYVNQKIKEIGVQILSGKKDAAPFDGNSCTYCAYREICDFNPKLPGCQYNKIQKLKKDEVFKKMEESLKCSKNGEQNGED